LKEPLDKVISIGGVPYVCFFVFLTHGDSDTAHPCWLAFVPSYGRTADLKASEETVALKLNALRGPGHENRLRVLAEHHAGTDSQRANLCEELHRFCVGGLRGEQIQKSRLV
jgi:hypothetical protein